MRRRTSLCNKYLTYNILGKQKKVSRKSFRRMMSWGMKITRELEIEKNKRRRSLNNSFRRNYISVPRQLSRATTFSIITYYFGHFPATKTNKNKDSAKDMYVLYSNSASHDVLASRRDIHSDKLEMRYDRVSVQ